jgi:hypothetical protein
MGVEEPDGPVATSAAMVLAHEEHRSRGLGDAPAALPLGRFDESGLHNPDAELIPQKTFDRIHLRATLVEDREPAGSPADLTPANVCGKRRVIKRLPGA